MNNFNFLFLILWSGLFSAICLFMSQGALMAQNFAVATSNATERDPAYNVFFNRAEEGPLQASGQTDDGFSWEIRDYTVSITDYDGDDADVVVPEEIDGRLVKKLNFSEKFLFSDKRERIESITLPSSLVSIGPNSFCAFPKLHMVVLPRNLETIDGNVFLNSPKLDFNALFAETQKFGAYALPEDGGIVWFERLGASVSIRGYRGSAQKLVLPDTIEDQKVVKIDDGAFEYAETLTEVTLPQTVDAIGEYAFAYCKNLRSIDLGKKLRAIGESAFYQCDNLESATLPESILTIGPYAFQSAVRIKEFDLPLRLGTIQLSSFAPEARLYVQFGSITEQAAKKANRPVLYRDETEETAPEKFLTWSDDGKNGVVVDGVWGDPLELTIPNELDEKPVVEIAPAAFQNARSLRSLTLPKTVVKIGNSAFNGCGNLEKIDSLKNVATLGKNAFAGCDKLDLTEAFEGNAKFGALSIGESQRFVVWYRRGEKSVAIIGSDGAAGKVVVPGEIDGLPVTTIGADAFSGNKSLKSVVLPPSVKKIKNYAFLYCSELVDLVLPEGLESVGSEAFDMSEAIKLDEAMKNCKNFGAIRLPNEDDEEDVAYLWYQRFDSGIVLRNILGAVETLTIPETIEGTPVTAVRNAVLGNVEEQVVFPASMALDLREGDDGDLGPLDLSKLLKISDSSLRLEFCELEDGVVIDGFKRDMEYVLVPDKVSGDDVLGIYRDAFYDSERLKAASIPAFNSLESFNAIAEYATEAVYFRDGYLLDFDQEDEDWVDEYDEEDHDYDPYESDDFYFGDPDDDDLFDDDAQLDDESERFEE